MCYQDPPLTRKAVFSLLFWAVVFAAVVGVFLFV